jgi:cell division protein FtsL
MARNRKTQTAAIRVGPVLLTIAFCILVVGAGLGYLKQKKMVEQLGKRHEELESAINKLEVRNRDLEKRLVELKTQNRIRSLAEQLGLRKPSRDQILILPDKSPDGWRHPQYAHRDNR